MPRLRDLAPVQKLVERTRGLVHRLGFGALRQTVSIAPEVQAELAPPNEAWSREGHPDWEIVEPPAIPVDKDKTPPASAVLTAHGWKSSIGPTTPGEDPYAWSRETSLGGLFSAPNAPTADALGVPPDPQNWGSIAGSHHQ